MRDENVGLVLSIIKDFFIESSKTKKNFLELYNKLTHPKNHIGLKLGVVPVYLGVIFHLYKEHAVIENINGKELEIKAETIENINKNPGNFNLILEDWNEEKQNYITKLAELFGNYIVSNEKEYNTFDYIVKAMQRWFLQLPKLTKESEQLYIGNKKFEKLDVKIKKFRNQLKNSELNSRELLFDKIPTLFDKLPGISLFDSIEAAKKTIDEIMPHTVNFLVEDMKKLFVGNKNASLVSVLQDWEENLKLETKRFLYDHGNELIFEYISTSNNDEDLLFSKITKHITGLRVVDWNESIVVSFLDSLEKFKQEVEIKNNIKGDKSLGEIGLYKISYIDENGKEDVKTLNKIETSNRANLLKNDITSVLEEFGESITTNEKRQVLLDIVQKLK